jgi:hypothetical protein
MKKPLKRLLSNIHSKIPGNAVLLRAYYAARYGNTQDIFKSKYERNAWGDNESVSGSGSTLRYTERIRAALPGLIGTYSVSSFLDAPCGDYNWFRHVKREPAFSYTGGDIVKELVDKNNNSHGDATTRFIHLDITKDPIPEADLWMCRDCLFHLSNKDIFRVLANLLRSNVRYFLTTTQFDCKTNIDIATGSYRSLNLELEPFSFGPPVTEIEDWVEGFPRRKMGLWETKDLAAALANNKFMSKV